MENDPIEELFRRKIDDTIPQEKPREAVWQKIEKELEPKTRKPLKAFIESVWFSAAVFALIAVPYFYFLIENMNKVEKINSIVYQDVQVEEGKFQTKEQNNQPLNLDSALEIVKNDPIKFEDNKLEKVTVRQSPQQVIESSNETQNYALESKSSVLNNVDTLALAKNSVIVSEKTKELDRLDSTLYAVNKSKMQASKERIIAEPTAASAPMPASAKVSQPISFYRNRFTLQSQINRASFEFVKKQENKLTFQNNDVKIHISRNNGMVELRANSNKMNAELMQLIIQNKENIYNYYINLPNPKNNK